MSPRDRQFGTLGCVSSTMLLVPFLTELDSRAAIKGSRDPLAVQSIWARLGRHVVGNLTTVTTSLPDFIVVLLGHYFVEQVERERGEPDPVATFLKWEQLAGYARAVINNERGFRGTDRVRLHLSAGPRVRLAADASAQILGNQKIYGLFGLYTAASKSSGLLEGDPVHLTPAARAFVEKAYLPRLERAAGRGAKGFVDRLRAPEYVLDTGGRDRPLLECVAQILKARPSAAERSFFRDHLVRGGPGDATRTRGLQAAFADVVATTFNEADWKLSPESIATLAARARSAYGGELLATKLERIRTCEFLIAPGVALFEFVLGCHGQTVDATAQRLHAHWGSGLGATIDLERTVELEGELGGWMGDGESGARWLRLARALAAGDYASAIETVLAQNAAVMRARGGAAAWADVRGGKIEVRFRDEQLGRLPEAAELPDYWRHAYFIDALRAIAVAVREAS